jgi:predicted transposase YbfD/YdcC
MDNNTNDIFKGGIETEAVLFEVSSLFEYLGKITDPRKPRGIRYGLDVLVGLLVLAKLCGEDELSGMAEWLRLRQTQLTAWLGLERRTLAHATTYRRLLAAVDLAEVEAQVGAFFQRQQQKGMVSLDGKTLRGTIPKGQRQGTHLLAAYQPETGVVLLKMPVDGKTNEITTAHDLVQQLDLTGMIVTGDAILTQKTLCEASVAAGGDYVLPVEANHPTTTRIIAEVFLPPLSVPTNPHFSFAERHNVQAGRNEWRMLTATPLLNTYLADWTKLGQVFRLQRIVQHKASGRLTYEVVFGITSLSPQQASAQDLLEIGRKHWHIENRLHYVRDVTFHEDACTVRDPHQQHALAILNNLALGLIRQHSPFPYVPQARRFFAASPHEALQLIL